MNLSRDENVSDEAKMTSLAKIMLNLNEGCVKQVYVPEPRMVPEPYVELLIDWRVDSDEQQQRHLYE
jgi:hypothetical protein